jgi:ribosomal-protein-alanine N-acetyltransferase
MPDYFLTTRRLGFRTWSEDDFDLALGLWGDLKVTELIDARGRLSPEQVRERLQREIATQQAHGVQYWPVFLLATAEHVGCCGLRPVPERPDVLELGFHIRSALWGQGYATEAARAVIRYAFDVLGVAGLFAGHHPRNEVSRRLLAKLGFQYTHDEFYPPTGLDHPSYLLLAASCHSEERSDEESPPADDRDREGGSICTCPAARCRPGPWRLERASCFKS